MVFGIGFGRKSEAKASGDGMKPIEVYELYADDTPEGKRYFSPFCWATRMAIAHKGIPVETIPWEFQESEKIDFSQQGKVPVIVDKNKRGKWVNDSWAIAKYLDATYPDRPSLLGGNTGEAGALFFQKWLFHYTAKYLMKLNLLEIHNKLPARLQPWFRETREATFQTTLENFVANDSNRDEVIADFRAALDPIRATLKEYPWLGGADGPKYADIYLMAFFMFPYAINPVKLLEEGDPIHDWRKRMFARYDSVLGGAVGYKESL